jgi:hypothetical protein
LHRFDNIYTGFKKSLGNITMRRKINRVFGTFRIRKHRYRHLLNQRRSEFRILDFSSFPSRGEEESGKDYYFMSTKGSNNIKNDDRKKYTETISGLKRSRRIRPM